MLFAAIENPGLALPTMVLEVVPVGLSGLILAGFISAMMSTADSALLASSTLFTNDVYRRFVDDPDTSDERYTDASRIGIVVLGAISIGAAVLIGDVVDALALAYNLLTGAIFVPVLGAFFWKGATWQGALSAIVGGSVVVVASMAAYGFGSDLPIVYGLAASLALFVGASLLTGPPHGGSSNGGSPTPPRSRPSSRPAYLYW